MSSGGWNSTGRIEADGLKRISALSLRKWGYLKCHQYGAIEWTNSWGEKSHVSIEVQPQGEDKFLRIFYTQSDYSGEKRDFDYKISLLTTPCRYGGSRYWFKCPWYVNGRYCGRKVAVLYKGGKHFACRHCHNLTYASRNAGGRYKGFVSAVDLDELEAKIGRKYYAGKPTRKYRRLLKMEERFNMGFLSAYLRLSGGKLP